MAITTLYQHASGPAFDNATFLGLRFDDALGFQPGESEWWVMFAARGGPQVNLGLRYAASRWFTDLWRSPAGVVYVADAEGEVHVNDAVTAPDSATRWTTHAFPCPIMGVWGLDDGCVYAWGSTPRTGFHVFQWDGKRWQDLPTPGFEVVALRGAAPDLVYAVGALGAIGHWNGRAWRRVASPVNEELVSVLVVSGDEQYATGSRGSLLEGSSSGWGKIAQGPSTDWPLHDVMKWGGALWIAAGPFGLLRRVKNTSQLEVVKDKARATAFDGRDALVITCDAFVAGTRDGVNFQFTGLDFLAKSRASKPLLDFS